MKTSVLVGPPVEIFIQKLAPEPRRHVRLAVRGLATGKGDVKALSGDLAGFYRLRVLTYRVIYEERFEAGTRVLDCAIRGAAISSLRTICAVAIQ